MTAGWGNRSEKGVVMPSRGHFWIRVAYATTEVEAQKKAAFLGEHDT